jgi:hypothetical protein
MSTIKATNITDLTGTYTSTTTAINRGIAKAWVYFDGTTVTPSTIKSSYNVASIARSAAGTYAVTMATPMVDNNYTVLASTGRWTGAGLVQISSASVFNFSATDGVGSSVDTAYCFAVVFR